MEFKISTQDDGQAAAVICKKISILRVKKLFKTDIAKY